MTIIYYEIKSYDKPYLIRDCLVWRKHDPRPLVAHYNCFNDSWISCCGEVKVQEGDRWVYLEDIKP